MVYPAPVPVSPSPRPQARNLGGTEGWTTVDRGIPRDTEYYHTPNEFTVVRINPGHLGLCQKTGNNRQIMRLLPGRYVLQERLVRYIGVAKIVPLANVQVLLAWAWFRPLSSAANG